MTARWWRLVLPLLLLVAGLAWWLAGRGQGQRPSVLIICIDTCRADRMGFMGCRLVDGSSPTPVLDAFARRCAPMREGRTSTPLTLPAHATLFSGLYPDRHGVRENDSFRMAASGERDFSLLAEDLRAAGYDTAAFVSGQPLEKRFGLAAGFRIYREPGSEDGARDQLAFRERSAKETTDDALAYLAGVGEQPFFLFVHYFDPHHPYLRSWSHPALGERKEDRYLSEIMRVDHEIGRLLGSLPAGAEDMLVLVVADHGEGLGEHGEESHGYLLHESTLRVPFILKPPAGVDASAFADLPGRLVDVHPTVLAVTGVPMAVPCPRDGRDLLAGSRGEWRHYAETLYPYYQFQYARQRAFVTPTRKLVEEGGGRAQLFAWREEPAEERDLAAEEDGPRRLLGQELDYWAARRTRGRAAHVMISPSAFSLYMGGRPDTMPVEPSAGENADLPRVAESWGTIRDLDRARRLIREGRPWEAALVLEPHSEAAARNPALLFWRARTLQWCGRDAEADESTRALKLEEAESAYRRHVELWKDGRSFDAVLKVLLERHELLGEGALLEEVVRLATGEIGASSAPRALTHVFRAQALEGLGRPREAREDYRSAADLQPGDPRHGANLRRLEGLLR